MKNFLPFLLAACCCAPLFSQNTTTWFVPGCQWKYQYGSIGGFGEEVFRDAGTEFIGGEICAKLHRTAYHIQFSVGWYQDHGYDYMFARNDSVFWWQNGFQLLYDFTLLQGDTFYLPPYLPPGFAVIDSAGTTDWQGIPLRFQDWRIFYDNIPPDIPPYSTRVYDRIGAEYLIYPSAGMGYPLSEIQYYLTCYRDDEYPQADCDLSYDPGYVGFPAGTATWSEETTVWCYFDGKQYMIAGDTVIWGVGQGKKVYYRPTYSGSYACPTPSAEMLDEPFRLIGLLDQSLLTKKVGFTRLTTDSEGFPVCLDTGNGNPFPLGETVLLYDFDLEPGDTVAWRSEPNIVLFTDSIQINDGSWRRTVHFKPDSSYYWIEGIGSNLGLLNSRANLNMTDVSCALHCFRQNNVLKYNTVDAAFCDSVIVGISEPPLDALVRLYPNPTTGNVLLEIPTGATPAWLRLFDAQGKLLHTREVTSAQTALDVSPWSGSAVLFLHIQSANRQQAGLLLRVAR